MSKYTTEVRFICENGAGLVESEGYKSINQIITDAIPKIFDFDFPIFDETYRSVLERKILKHYYTREICAETVGLWKHFLSTRLNEIMPYYNKLYQSELLQFNPLRDVDITKDHSGSGNKESESNRTDSETTGNTRTDNLSETTGNTRTDNLSRVTQDSGTEGESGSEVNKNDHWDMYSDTPQGALTNVRNESYLTNARHVTDDGTGSTHNTTTTFGKKVTETDTGTVGHSGSKSNTGTVTDSGTRGLTSGSTEEVSTTDEYLEHIVGKTGGTSYSKLLLEYRETFMNIDMMIIDDLSDLFFNLW